MSLKKWQVRRLFTNSYLHTQNWCLALNFHRLHISWHLLYSVLGKLHSPSFPQVSWTHSIVGGLQRFETQGQCCYLNLRSVLHSLKNRGETQENSCLHYINILATPVSVNVQFVFMILVRIERMPEYKHCQKHYSHPRVLWILLMSNSHQLAWW